MHHHSLGDVQSIDRAKQELLNGSPNDDLVLWVTSSVPNEFFNSGGETEVVNALQEIMMWS